MLTGFVHFTGVIMRVSPNPMKKYLLSGFLLLAAALPALAALGETEPELEARYGKAAVVKNANDPANYVTRAYSTKDYIIMVTFVDGKSQDEHYASTKPLSEKEISDLLYLNKMGSRWQETLDKVRGEDRKWLLENGDGVAVLQFDGNELDVSTRRFADDQAVRLIYQPPPDLSKLLNPSGQ